MFASVSLKRRIAALALIASWSSGCAPAASSCPPVAPYEQALLDRVAGEIQQLGEGSATARLLSDYAVLREQLRVCQ